MSKQQNSGGEDSKDRWPDFLINLKLEFLSFISFPYPFDSFPSEKEAGMTHKCGKHENVSHLNYNRTHQLCQSLTSHVVLLLSFSEIIFMVRGSPISLEASQILSISSFRKKYFLVLH